MAESKQAVRMRKLIREAFLELLESKPLLKISVGDIVEKADISRSTFYRYYGDVFELLYECTALYNGGGPRNEPEREDDDFIEKLYDNVREGYTSTFEHRSVYDATKLAGSVVGSGYAERNVSESKAHIANVLKKMGCGPENCIVDFDYAVDVLQGLFFDSVQRWIDQGCNDPVDEAAGASMLLFFRFASSLSRKCPIEELGQFDPFVSSWDELKTLY